MTRDADLQWRGEEACRRAWPTPHEITRDGWLFRFGGGARRRTNSISPSPGPRTSIEETLSFAQTFYGERTLPILFCIPSMAAGADDILASHGYMPIARTRTLLAEFEPTQRSSVDPAVELSDAPDAEWFRAHLDLNGFASDHLPAFRETAAAIQDAAAFVAYRQDGVIAAQAYGVVCDGLLVIEAVVTGAAYRRQGLARATVNTLMAWAQDRGATAACLQVLADNAPALALYRALGFERDLYRYHYRAQPGSRWSEDNT